MKRDTDLKKYFKEWRFTKNSYTSWVSNTKLRKFFAQNLVIRNFSIWGATSIVSKDNLNKKNWYINLNKKVNNNKSFSNNKINLFKFYVIFFLKFFKNFFIYIIWNIILKLISFSRFKKVNKENCFHSFNYNFFFEKKNIFF